MIAKLPPSVQMVLFLVVGIILGSIGGYKYAIQYTIAKAAENELEVIVEDQRVTRKIDKDTSKILSKIRKENAEDKPFDCSNAVLPDDRVQRLQREIDNARQRSNGTLLDNAINKASNL